MSAGTVLVERYRTPDTATCVVCAVDTHHLLVLSTAAGVQVSRYRCCWAHLGAGDRLPPALGGALWDEPPPTPRTRVRSN